MSFQIKVEPPDIRDIDEEEPSGWESPKLVIDLVSCRWPKCYLQINWWYKYVCV